MTAPLPDLAELTSGGPVLLLTLTDEELAALEGSPLGVGQRPYLASLPPEQVPWVTATGLRALVARGLAEPEPGPAGAPTAGAPGLRPLGALAVVLALRAVGARAVSVTSTTAAGGVDLLLTVGPDGWVLSEQTTPAGLHLFTVASQAQAVGLLLLLAPQASSPAPEGTGADALRVLDARTVQDPDDARWARLRRDLEGSETVSELLTAGDGEQQLVTLYDGPEGTWLVGGPAGGDAVTAERCTPARLEARLERLLSGAAARGDSGSVPAS